MSKDKTQYTSMTIGMVSEIRLSEMLFDDGTFGHFIRIEDDNGNVYSLTLHTDKRESAKIVFDVKRNLKEED